MTSLSSDTASPVPEIADRDPVLALSPAPRTLWGDSWRRFRANKAAVASLIVLVLAGIMAAFAPIFTHYDPMHFTTQQATWYAGPSAEHWLGTDDLGRDLYARILYGMRGPLAVAFAGAVLCTLLGALIGVAAGLYGGWIDGILNRITELIWVVPGLLLILLFMALYGRALDGLLPITGRYIMLTIFLATDGWPLLMRVARAETLRLREAPFIEAAQVIGGTRPGMIRRHLLPNIMGILLVQGALLIPGFIFSTSALGYLGLMNPLVPDLGQMINAGSSYLQMDAGPTLITVTVISILILAATFLGDGLRDAFDTRAT